VQFNAAVHTTYRVPSLEFSSVQVGLTAFRACGDAG